MRTRGPIPNESFYKHKNIKSDNYQEPQYLRKRIVYGCGPYGWHPFKTLKPNDYMRTIKETTRKLLEFFEMENLTVKDMLRALYFSLSLVNIVIMGGIGSSWTLMIALAVFIHATWQFVKIGRNLQDE